MLENTFIHLPNFGYQREKALWNSGVRCWDDFLGRFNDSSTHHSLCSIISNSRSALHHHDSAFFASRLQANEHWRTFPNFPKVAYIDIETTGLGRIDDHITVIGLYDGQKTSSYIHGQNLDDFANDIKNYDLGVTFNGSVFDFPFIRKQMPHAQLPTLHIDLRFVLSSLNIWGGLKKIEAQFGLERESDLAGLNGYDAVKLWQKYKKNNDLAALDKLVRYNSADISNLSILVKWAYDQKRKKSGFDC